MAAKTVRGLTPDPAPARTRLLATQAPSGASEQTSSTIAQLLGQALAGDVAVTPAGGIAATNVQAALNELDTEKASLAFATVAVAGQGDVVADGPADTLTLAAGTNVTITTTPGSDTVTIAATGGGAAPVASVFTRTGAVVAAANDYNADQIAETGTNKILTSTERTKLAGISAGAQVNPTDAAIEASYNTQVSVVSQAEAEVGTATAVRRWTAERVKQAVLALAPANLVASVFGRTGAVVQASGDYNADQITETGAGKIMTSAERTKLAGVATGAQVNPTDSAIAASYNTQVAQVSQAEAQAGAVTTDRRWTPERVKQAILALAPASAVASVFTRTGVVVAASGDYNAGQVSETATAKILTDVERTKLAGVATGAQVNPTDAAIETSYNNQVPAVTQAEAQAGTSTGIRRWTPERVKQAILALVPAAPVTTVFTRAGAVVAASGDYTAAQVTETATAKIMTDVERTKLSGIATGAQVNPSDAAIETSYNNQVTAASQAEAEAGTVTAIRRFTPERIKQAILALSPFVVITERTLSATGGTVIASDHGKRIVCTATGTHTVSNAATLGNGFACDIVNDAGGNVVLDGPGGTNVTMADQEVATIICCNSKVRVAKGASVVV